MPALPSPEPGFSWRRAAAQRLRGVAAWLDRGSDRDPGSSGAGVSGAGALSAGASTPSSWESSTPVRGLNVEGAPEHWVQLLRDAGLIPPAVPTDTPPVARPTLRVWGRSWRVKQAPQDIPMLRLRTDRPESPLVAGPDVRGSGPKWGAKQAPQHTPTHVAGPDMLGSGPTWGAEQTPQHTPLVAGPDVRGSGPKWGAKQAPQHTPTHVAGP
ncbi:hypothetical protein ABIE18_003749, partial [Arthrobacter sp. 2762]